MRLIIFPIQVTLYFLGLAYSLTLLGLELLACVILLVFLVISLVIKYLYLIELFNWIFKTKYNKLNVLNDKKFYVIDENKL